MKNLIYQLDNLADDESNTGYDWSNQRKQKKSKLNKNGNTKTKSRSKRPEKSKWDEWTDLDYA